MGQNSNNQKKMPWEKDWSSDTPSASAPSTGQMPWEKDYTVQSKFSPDNIDVNYNAPASVRFEVGALEKPEDRLAAVQKHYPDAEPYADGNFIMSDPQTGKTMLYKQDGWRMPSFGDLASIVPEAAEGVGAGVGGILGGAGGATVGSAVPFAGTVSGGVAGAMAGAGAGGAAAKDAVERGINYLYGNQDTRTLTDYAKDKALDVAANAAGEGAGIGVAKLASTLATPFKAFIAGGMPSAAKTQAAQQVGKDFAEAGVNPTVGMVTKSPMALSREANLTAKYPNGRVSQAQQALDANLDQQFGNITSGIASATDPAGRVMSWQGAGEGLVKAAQDAKTMMNSRLNTAYKDVDAAVGGDPVTASGSVQKSLDALQAEKKGLTASDKLNKAGAIDDAIEQTKAINSDLKKGITFGQGQDMRTTIGNLAFDKTADPVFTARMKNLYGAITDDLGTTAKNAGGDVFDKWKAADALNTSQFSPTGPMAGLKPMLKPGATGQDAMNAFTRSINDGDKNIAAARQSLEAAGGMAAVDKAVATTLSDMGMHTSAATGEQFFSPSKFFKNWNNVSPEARSAMLSGTTRSQYAGDMDRLARMVQTRQASATAKPGVDNSSSDLLTQTFKLGATPFVAAKNAYMQRLMTDPVVVKWWTGIPSAQLKKGGLGNQFNVLRNYAREKFKQGTDDGRQTANAIDQYLKDIGQ